MSWWLLSLALLVFFCGDAACFLSTNLPSELSEIQRSLHRRRHGPRPQSRLNFVCQQSDQDTIPTSCFPEKKELVGGSAPFRAASCLLLSALLATSPPALAAVVPNVVDDAKVFATKERSNLEENLQNFQDETSYKIRVLTRDPRGRKESMSSQELRTLWGLPDPKSVVVVVDISRGNVLNFNSGAQVAKLLPDRFFNELTGRLGNLYAVREEGENGVVEEAVDKIETCLRREKGCYVVPGIGKDQYQLSLAASCAGGLVFGASLLTASQFRSSGAKGSDAIFKFAPVLFSPLWVLFLGGLGLNPLLQRGVEFQLIAQNLGGFGAAAVVMFLAYPAMLRLWGGYL